MEDSINSLSDNEGDNDTPLKQVVQLCSMLAEKGMQFSISVRIKNSFQFSLKSESPKPHQGKRRSPSYVRRQERRKLLRKKTDSFPEEPMESRETNKDCSLDLSPHPDSGLFGYREESEEESVSAKSEADGSESGEDSDANEESSDASSEDPVEPGEGEDWTPVTSRRRGSGRVPSPTPIVWQKHIVKTRANLCMSRSTSLFHTVTVYARDDAAFADIYSAVEGADFRKIKTIQGLHATLEFSSDGKFLHSGHYNPN